MPEPIIRPALFADPAFTVPNVMNVLASLAGFSILLLTPYYLVNVLQLSALMSGLVLALAFAGSLTGAPLSAFFVRADRPAADGLCRRQPGRRWVCCRLPSPAPRRRSPSWRCC